MKRIFKNSIKISNGITLIALVITIIVLLILAGVSIGLAVGDNSVVKKGALANENTKNAETAERARLAFTSVIMDGTGIVTKEKFEEAINTEFSEKENVTIEEDVVNNEFIVKKDNVEIDRIEKYSTQQVDTSKGLWYGLAKISDDRNILSQLKFIKESNYSANIEWFIPGNIKIITHYYIETDAETGDSRVVVEPPIRTNLNTNEVLSQINGTLNGEAIELGTFLIEYLESFSMDELAELANK